MLTAPQQDWKWYRQHCDKQLSVLPQSTTTQQRWVIYRDLYELVWTIKLQLPPTVEEISRGIDPNSKWANKEQRRVREVSAFQQLGPP